MKRGWVASEPQTEQRQGSVGLPDAHRYRGQGMHVPGERAQARNLGGTAKQPFALNEGGRLFLTTWENCAKHRATSTGHLFPAKLFGSGNGHGPPGTQSITQSIVQRALGSLIL